MRTRWSSFLALGSSSELKAEEPDGHLLVAFTTNKMTVEVLKFSLEQLDRLQPVAAKAAP